MEAIFTMDHFTFSLIEAVFLSIIALVLSWFLILSVNHAETNNIRKAFKLMKNIDCLTLPLRPVGFVFLISFITSVRQWIIEEDFLNNAFIVLNDVLFIIFWIIFALIDRMKHPYSVKDIDSWRDYFKWSPQLHALFFIGFLFILEILLSLPKIF